MADWSLLRFAAEHHAIEAINKGDWENYDAPAIVNRLVLTTRAELGCLNADRGGCAPSLPDSMCVTCAARAELEGATDGAAD